MRRVFDDLKERLAAFLDQRDAAALVLSAPDDEALLVAKCLEEVDDTRASELFWVHTEPFEEPESYVSAVADAFVAKHAGVSLRLEEKGEAPWPPLPAEILDEELHPADRLRAIMTFSRELLPDPEGGRCVWGLWPLVIEHRRGWAWLMGHLLRHELPSPWCRRLRIVVRTCPDDAAMDEALVGVPRVLRDEARLSQDDMQKALDQEAADDDLPLPRRLLSLLLSAHVDYSHGRPEEALRKYRVLLDYHVGTRNPAMTALVLNGIGEVHRKMGNAAGARRCFEAAVEPAASAEHPPVPVLLSVTLNLANLRMEEERWSEAAGYYDSAQKLATLQRDAPTKLSALENLGVCRYVIDEIETAEETWRAGATVAQELQMYSQQRRFLHRLRWHYDRVSDDEARDAVAEELEALRRERRRSRDPDS